MRQKSDQPKEPAEKVIKKIRCVTRKQYSAEEKIRMVQKARAVGAPLRMSAYSHNRKFVMPAQGKPLQRWCNLGAIP